MQGKPQVNAAPSTEDGEELSAFRSGGVHTGPAGDVPPDVGRHQLAVAMTWVHRGVPVVPCSRTDKGALVPGFGKDATPEQLATFLDKEQVESWWCGRFKRAHVGLLTRSLVVIDLDMGKPDTAPLGGRWSGCQHGTDVLERLAAEHGAPWPETYTVMTPSGGLHLYFLQPDSKVGCATGDGGTPPHLGPLIDVRGIGGYVIAAGSYSAAQGRMYTRISDPATGPQPLPAWLLALLRPASPPSPTRTPTPLRALPTGTRAERYAAAALRGEVDKLRDRAHAGEYWTSISAAALRLAELHSTAPGVLTEQAVEDALVPVAVAAGMQEREATRAVRSAWKSKAGAGLGGAA